MAIDTGVIELLGARREKGDATMTLPFVDDARCAIVPSGTSVVVRGGTWELAHEDPRYREAGERRLLRGTPEHPLEVARS